MPARHWNIGICGTFDVANYGDLLFPLLAEAELSERLGSVTLHRFSYNGKLPPSWPYEVTSIAALPDVIHGLDGLLIGGGFLIRFDKTVAPEYDAPLSIHHPTGYWLTPALIALQHGVPVVWNAPGMHRNDIPAWAAPLLGTALTESAYVAVRDEPSRAALEPYSARPISVVPDTAFGLARLLNPDAPPSAAVTQISRARGLDRPYIIVQAALGSAPFVHFLRSNSRYLGEFQILLLPVSPAMGESCGIMADDLPGAVCLDASPHPLVLAELIGRAQAVLGHSYHLSITALTSGVPVFTRQDLFAGKYTALQGFDSVHSWPAGADPPIDWFLDRVGRVAPSQSVRDAGACVQRHWDRAAQAICDGPAPTASTMNRLWQSLPSLLEESACREQEAVDAMRRERLDAADRLSTVLQLASDAKARLVAAIAERDVSLRESASFRTDLAFLNDCLRDVRFENAALNSRIAELVNSVSWRVTAPARFLGRRLSQPEGNDR